MTRKFFPSLAALASVLTFGIPIRAALIIALFMATMIWSGQKLLRWATIADPNVGASLLVGLSLQVFGSQALLRTGISSSIAHWLCLCLLLLLGLIASRSISGDQSKDNENSSHLEILVLTALLFSVRQSWLLPFSICLTAGFLLGNQWRHRSIWFHRLGPLALIALGLAISNSLRPHYWWYHGHSNDLQFFEALSWTSAEWGVTEHPGFVGGTFLNYHWFSYAFVGSLSRLAQLDPYVGLAVIGRPILLFCFTATIIGSCVRHRQQPKLTHLLAAATGLSVMPWLRMDSLSFSIFVAFIYFEVSTAAKKIRWRQVTIFLLLAITLSFSKVTTAAIVLVVLLVVCLRSFLSRQVNQLLIPALVLFVSLAALSIALFRTNPAGNNLFEISPTREGFTREILEFWESGYLVAQLGIWITVIAAGFRKSIVPKSLTDQSIFVAVLLLVTSWVQAGKESQYLGYPAIYFATFFLITQLEPPSFTGRRLPIASVAVIFGCAALAFGARPLLRRLNDVSGIGDSLGGEIWGVVLASGFTMLLVLLLALTASIGSLKIVRLKLTSLARVLAFSLGLSALVGQFIGYSIDTYRRERAVPTTAYENWPFNSSAFPSSDLREIGRWIRLNTGPSEILASNNFSFRGNGWWLRVVNDVDSHARRLRETSWGGANYLLPAESRRRYLVQGPRFLLGYSLPSSEFIRRMNVSMDFANRPSQSVLEDLKAYGVTGFVVNTELALESDWSSFATERFRNGTYVYLDIG